MKIMKKNFKTILSSWAEISAKLYQIKLPLFFFLHCGFVWNISKNLEEMIMHVHCLYVLRVVNYFIGKFWLLNSNCRKFIFYQFHIILLISRDDIFSVIYLISDIFLWKLLSESFWTRSEQVKNDHFERGCSWLEC